MKLVKPFSTFRAKGTLREQGSIALRDPGYWLLWAILAALIYIALTQ